MDDDAARRERLEQFAEQQRRLHQWRAQPVPPASVIQRVADKILGRGLDTAQRTVVDEHAHPDRVIYVPTAWHVLPRALRRIGVSDDDTFADLGCGKGRILHQAAKQPFRKVIGVEVSPTLADAARANLAAQSHRYRCKSVEVVVADVREFRVPDDLTVVFIFHAFHGETLDAVLKNIVDSLDRNPRRLRLIYTYPVFASQVLATGRFRVLAEQRSGLRRDGLARTTIYENC